MTRRSYPREEAERRDHLMVATDPIADAAGGALYVRHGPEATIVISPDLHGRVYDMALAHELEHDEIGVLAPAATPATMEKTENQADRRAVARLLPPAELEAYVAAREADGEPISVRDVADHFGVADQVAERACGALQGRRALTAELEREHGAGRCGYAYPDATTRGEATRRSVPPAVQPRPR